MIYIISASSGSYSDRNDWRICACLTKERAEEILNKIFKLRNYNINYINKLVVVQQECRNKYSNSMPGIQEYIKAFEVVRADFFNKNYDLPEHLKEIQKFIALDNFDGDANYWVEELEVVE